MGWSDSTRFLIAIALAFPLLLEANSRTAGAQPPPTRAAQASEPDELPPLPPLPDPTAVAPSTDTVESVESTPAPAPAEAAPAAGAAPAEAEKETPAPSAPETNWVSKLLGIQDAPVKVSGWIQNSFTGNTNGTPKSGGNFSVFPNRLANQWQGNQYYLILEKPLETGAEPSFGFRFDTLFGNDWQFSKDYGLFDRAFTPNSFAGVDLPQMYVETHLPFLTEGGIDFRAGRYYSPSGFESVQATKRPLLSVAYLFNFTPFTYLGFQSTWHLTPRLNWVNSVVNGNDRWFDERYRPNYQGGFNWTSNDEKTTLASYILVGPNQLPTFPAVNQPFLPLGVQQSNPARVGTDNHLYPHHPRVYLDMVVTHKWTEKLTQAADAFFLIDTGVPLTNGGVLRQTSWFGAANWFLYTFDDDEKLTGVWRSEIFEDSQGTATGVAGTYFEQTLGMIYKPKPWLWIRPEARYDWNQFAKPFSNGTRGSQFLLAFDVILLF